MTGARDPRGDFLDAVVVVESFHRSLQHVTIVWASASMPCGADCSVIESPLAIIQSQAQSSQNIVRVDDDDDYAQTCIRKRTTSQHAAVTNVYHPLRRCSQFIDSGSQQQLKTATRKSALSQQDHSKILASTQAAKGQTQPKARRHELEGMGPP
ncbi:hypothetical protein XA68_13453 [Ophiocordyceps unilateralis]|uniref:Uncharacterized protein n=1 Tax=Ophiocordyceps unilateralis TaxID=268505 RepID=A0A2A9PCH3_OPHUN|nr:hypothetical protein XA68_13453 [Ophiocordyceps unilateralis]